MKWKNKLKSNTLAPSASVSSQLSLSATDCEARTKRTKRLETKHTHERIETGDWRLETGDLETGDWRLEAGGWSRLDRERRKEEDLSKTTAAATAGTTTAGGVFQFPSTRSFALPVSLFFLTSPILANSPIQCCNNAPIKLGGPNQHDPHSRSGDCICLHVPSGGAFPVRSVGWTQD